MLNLFKFERTPAAAVASLTAAGDFSFPEVRQ